MNERIKQLARTAREQMVVLTAVDDEQWRRHEEFVEKFAELIVKECAQACINMGNDYEIKSAGQYQAELFAFAIKKRFGVEE